MIQRLSDKKPFCKYCLGSGHSAFTCPRKPRNTLQTRSTLKTTKPMNKVGRVAKATNAATAKWARNYKGDWNCHYCHVPVESLVAEHMESKTRRADLRTDPTNFVPTCAPCNKAKGSKSHDEIPHSCDLNLVA